MGIPICWKNVSIVNFVFAFALFLAKSLRLRKRQERNKKNTFGTHECLHNVNCASAILDIYQSKTKPSFEKEVFIEMVHEIMTGGISLYNGNYYKQINSVTMGLLLGPTMANFCMLHYETRLLTCKHESCIPTLYLVYVDDIFCMSRGKSQHEDFLNKLNNMHKNKKFT